MIWLLFAYIWVCALFGFWYFYPKMKESRNVDSDCEEIVAFVLGTLITPLGWPLMVFDLLQKKKAREKAEIEKLRRGSNTF
jgi:hypothetical protein